MVARVSAMMTGDYDGWLRSWDAESAKMLRDADVLHQRSTSVWIEQWRGIFKTSKINLVRRITYGSFVIITYKFVNQQTGISTEMELPTVFRQVNGDWWATQQLRSDLLLRISPWASGRTRIEEDMP